MIKLYDRNELFELFVPGPHSHSLGMYEGQGAGLNPNNDRVLASLLALNPPVERWDFLASLLPDRRKRLAKLLTDNGVSEGVPPPEAEDREPRKYDYPACCRQVGYNLIWLEPGKVSGGPDRAGWCIDQEGGAVRVRFCPMCGKNLAAVKPRVNPLKP